jgi:hypothetical protein
LRYSGGVVDVTKYFLSLTQELEALKDRICIRGSPAPFPTPSAAFLKGALSVLKDYAIVQSCLC